MKNRSNQAASEPNAPRTAGSGDSSSTATQAAKHDDRSSHLDSFLRHLPGFAWMKDVEGRYVYANTALQEVEPYCHGWLGKTDAELWPPQVADIYRENDVRVIRERKALETLEPYLIRGELHYVAVSKFPIMDEGGVVVMVGGASIDVSELKSTGERLREYEKVVEGVEEMIAVVDRDYRYLLANRAFLRYRRKEREDVVGRLIWEVLDPNAVRDIIKPKLDECFAGQAVNFEMQYVYADGGPRDLLISYFPIEGENGVDRVACVLQDITIRKRAEEALKQSQHQMAEAQRLARVGSWTWDVQTDVLTWSEELYTIYGENPETFRPTYTSFLAHVHPDEREAYAKAIAQGLEDLRPFSYRRRIVRPDGQIRTIDSYINIVADAHGKPRRMVGASQDVTEGVQTEEARRVAEQKYQEIFENAREGIFRSTPDGHYLVANPALARMHGFDSPEDLIRERTDIPREVYVDPSRRDEFKRLIETNGGVQGFEFQLARKDGATIWVSVNARASRDENGNIEYYEGSAEDITERKQAQEALRQSEERYRELFENSRDAIYVHDLNGRYTSVNRAAEDLSGYTREEIIGKHYSNFVLPAHLKAVRENFCRKLDVPLETTYETQIACKNGTRKPVEVSSRMIYRNGEPAGVQGTVRDITERKRAQRALQTYSRRLVNAQEAERAIIARELHDDIGQALTAISINLESLHRSGAVNESAVPRLRESIDVIDNALRRVRELSFELRPALLDDLGLAAALTWYAARFSERTGIRTTVSGDLQLKGIDRSVETACFRIVQEALTNTARYAGASEATIHVERRNGALDLAISDNGIGFAVDSFVGPTRATNALGLRGMEERASDVGGHVNIISEQGKGTQVILRVPTAPSRSY